MKGPIERKSKTRVLGPSIRNWRHWVDVTIGFSMPGDTIVLPDQESYDYTMARLKSYPRAGILVRGPAGESTSSGIGARPQDRAS